MVINISEEYNILEVNNKNSNNMQTKEVQEQEHVKFIKQISPL